MAGRKVDIKKAQYYVCYLGWLESLGLRGRECTDPVVYALQQRARVKDRPVTKLTVQISKKEIKLTQEMEKGRAKVEKVKYPAIPSKDVTFASQGPAPDSDVVAAVYLGYNPQTKRAVHVHCYRCDSAETAARMVGHLNHLVDIPEHKSRHAKVERDLIQEGLLEPRQGRYPETVEGRAENSPVIMSHNGRKAGSTGSSGGSGAGSEGRDTPSLPVYDSVAAELREKLQRKNKNVPILLPPRDYDTISRSHGKVDLQLHSSPPGQSEGSSHGSDNLDGQRQDYRTDSGVELPPDYDEEGPCNTSHGSSQFRAEARHMSRSSSHSSSSDWSHDPGKVHQDDGYYPYDIRAQNSPRPGYYPVPVERRGKSPNVERRVRSPPPERRVKSMGPTYSPAPQRPQMSPRIHSSHYPRNDLNYSLPERELRLMRQASQEDQGRRPSPLPEHLRGKPVGKSSSFQARH